MRGPASLTPMGTLKCVPSWLELPVVCAINEQRSTLVGKDEPVDMGSNCSHQRGAHDIRFSTLRVHQGGTSSNPMPMATCQGLSSPSRSLREAGAVSKDVMQWGHWWPRMMWIVGPPLPNAYSSEESVMTYPPRDTAMMLPVIHDAVARASSPIHAIAQGESSWSVSRRREPGKETRTL